MRVLALDTTTPAGSVALVDEDRVVDERGGDPSRTHAQRLPGDLLRVLERRGLAMSDIDLFAVASGPGSFTGLRIGIATILSVWQPQRALSQLLAESPEWRRVHTDANAVVFVRVGSATP